MRITVLGGAGKMACISVQYLAQDPRVDEVVLADLDLDQARVVAGYINSPKITVDLLASYVIELSKDSESAK